MQRGSGVLWKGVGCIGFKVKQESRAARANGHGNRFLEGKHALESYKAEFFLGITLMNSLLLA